MDVYEARGIVTIEKATQMIGKKVSAVGTCGIGDGVIINGILREVLPDAIVLVGKIPYSVNKNTLKLISPL